MEPSEKAHCDGVEITAIGVLYKGPLEKKYWSSSRGKEKYPYPIGYQATRWHGGHSYLMDVSEGPRGPSFTVTCEEGIACSGQTPSVPWENILKKRHAGAKKVLVRSASASIDGPEMFGFTSPLVQRLCRDLVVSENGLAELSDKEIDTEVQDGHPMHACGAESRKNGEHAESSRKSPLKARRVKKLTTSCTDEIIEQRSDVGDENVEQQVEKFGKPLGKHGKKRLHVQEESGFQKDERLSKKSKEKLEDLNGIDIRAKRKTDPDLSKAVGANLLFGISEDEEMLRHTARTKRPRSLRARRIHGDDLDRDTAPQTTGCLRHPETKDVMTAPVLTWKRRLKSQNNNTEQAAECLPPISSKRFVGTDVSIVQDSLSPGPVSDTVVEENCNMPGPESTTSTSACTWERRVPSVNGSSQAMDNLDSATVDKALPKNVSGKKRLKLAKPDKTPEFVKYQKYGTNVDLTDGEGVLSIELICPSVDDMKSPEAISGGEHFCGVHLIATSKDSGSSAKQDGVFLLLEACNLTGNGDIVRVSTLTGDKGAIDVKRKQISSDIDPIFKVSSSSGVCHAVDKLSHQCEEDLQVSHPVQTSGNFPDCGCQSGEPQKVEVEAGDIRKGRHDPSIALSLQEEIPGFKIAVMGQALGSIQVVKSRVMSNQHAVPTPESKCDSVSPIMNVEQADTDSCEIISPSHLPSPKQTYQGIEVISNEQLLRPKSLAILKDYNRDNSISVVKFTHGNSPAMETSNKTIVPVMVPLDIEARSELDLGTKVRPGNFAENNHMAENSFLDDMVSSSIEGMRRVDPDMKGTDENASWETLSAGGLSLPFVQNAGVKVMISEEPGIRVMAENVSETTDLIKNSTLPIILHSDFEAAVPLVLPADFEPINPMCPRAKDLTKISPEKPCVHEVASLPAFVSSGVGHATVYCDTRVTTENVSQEACVADVPSLPFLLSAGLKAISELEVTSEACPEKTQMAVVLSTPLVLPAGVELTNGMNPGFKVMSEHVPDMSGVVECFSQPVVLPSCVESINEVDLGLKVNDQNHPEEIHGADVLSTGVELGNYIDPDVKVTAKKNPEKIGDADISCLPAMLPSVVEVIIGDEAMSEMDPSTEVEVTSNVDRGVQIKVENDFGRSAVAEVLSHPVVLLSGGAVASEVDPGIEVIAENVLGKTRLTEVCSLPLVISLGVEVTSEEDPVLQMTAGNDPEKTGMGEISSLPVILPSIKVASEVCPGVEVVTEKDSEKTLDLASVAEISSLLELSSGVEMIIEVDLVMTVAAESASEKNDLGEALPLQIGKPGKENGTDIEISFGKILDSGVLTVLPASFQVDLLTDTLADLLRNCVSQPDDSLTDPRGTLNNSIELGAVTSGVLMMEVDSTPRALLGKDILDLSVKVVPPLITAVKKNESDRLVSFGKINDHGVVTLLSPCDQVDSADTLAEEEPITQTIVPDDCNKAFSHPIMKEITQEDVNISTKLTNQLPRDSKLSVHRLSFPSPLSCKLDTTNTVSEAGQIVVKGVQSHQVDQLQFSIPAKQPVMSDMGFLWSREEKIPNHYNSEESKERVLLKNQDQINAKKEMGLEQYADIKKAGLKTPRNKIQGTAVTNYEEEIKLLKIIDDLPSQLQLTVSSQDQTQKSENDSMGREITKSFLSLLLPQALPLLGNMRSTYGMSNYVELEGQTLPFERNTAIDESFHKKKLLILNENLMIASEFEVDEDKNFEVLPLTATNCLARDDQRDVELREGESKAKEHITTVTSSVATLSGMSVHLDGLLLVQGLGPRCNTGKDPKRSLETTHRIGAVVTRKQETAGSAKVIDETNFLRRDKHLQVEGPFISEEVFSVHELPSCDVQVRNLGCRSDSEECLSVTVIDVNDNPDNCQDSQLNESHGGSLEKANVFGGIEEWPSLPVISPKLQHKVEGDSAVGSEYLTGKDILDYEGLSSVVQQLNGYKRMDSTLCIDHPFSVSAMVLNVRGNDVRLCIVCSSAEGTERTFFVYKIFSGENVDITPQLLSTMTSTYENSGCGHKIPMEESTVRFAPDGQHLLLLDHFKFPDSCYPNMGTSDGHGVNVVSLEKDAFRVFKHLPSDEMMQCLAVPGPQLLIAAGNNGCINCWEMEFGWRTCKDRYSLPRAIYNGASFTSVTKLSVMPGLSHVIIGCDYGGLFALWDTSSRTLLSSCQLHNHNVLNASLLDTSTINLEHQKFLGEYHCKLGLEENATSDSLSGLPCLLTLFSSGEVPVLNGKDDLTKFEGDVGEEDTEWSCKTVILTSSGFLCGPSVPHRASAVTSMGGYGVLGTTGGLVHIWDVASGKKIYELSELEGSSIVKLVTNPSSAVLAAANAKGQVILYMQINDFDCL